MIKVGDTVRFNGGKSDLVVSRVWTIDRGPDAGRAKVSASRLIETPPGGGPFYRGYGCTIIAAVEDFEVVR